MDEGGLRNNPGSRFLDQLKLMEGFLMEAEEERVTIDYCRPVVTRLRTRTVAVRGVREGRIRTTAATPRYDRCPPGLP